MTDEQHDREEEAEARRPRVVDKRISSRGPSSEIPTAPTQADSPAGATQAESPPASPVEGQAPPRAASEPSPPAEEAKAAPDELWTPEQEAQARKLAQEMAEVPSLDWVINVAVSLANAAGVKLNTRQLEDARLAIDALAGLMGSVGTRLEDAETPLRQTLADLQMAYSQISAAPPPPQSSA